MDIELAAIQSRLIELGQQPGPIDGVWGAQTRGAIAAHLGIKPAQVKKAGAAVEAPWLERARAEIGVHEVSGKGSNAIITGYFVAASGQAHPDEVPWCAAFVGAMLAATGYAGTRSLMARSYLNWGSVLPKPKRGAIVVLSRGAAPAGHVAFVDEWTSSTLKCIGGNQSNAVTVQNFSRSSGVLGFRWPKEAAA